ncbi:MAG: glycosyltransferase family 2 protein [Bdellovibrionales bacterium]|nr:glycosyltransferase family 2 protein [Bdellovibrionales bacterium]
MMELSIVMPVYNEAGVLASSLDEALSTVVKASYPCEILLVDDASSDQSFEILQEYQKRYPQTIRVLRHQSNRGIMGALKTLFSEARGRYIFFNSSDGQFRTSDVLRMMDLRDSYDLIVGQRKQKLYNMRRHLVSWFFNFLPKVFFGVETYDAGSVKLYRADVLKIPLISQSPFREAERIIRAKKLGFRVGAIPVIHYQRRAGRATGAEWKLLAESCKDLFRCWVVLDVFSTRPKEIAG